MYTKVFASLFDGSMRGQADLILVFVNLLCHTDQDGIVDLHWKAIADETGLSPERVGTALTKLESPDPESRSRNDDGRRLKRIDPERDWGWEVINFKKYDGIRRAADRRVYMRDFMAEKRKSIKAPASEPVSEISKLVKQIQDCRMEFKELNQMSIENALKDVPIKNAQSAVNDFCRDMLNALKVPDTPLKLLAGYLRKSCEGGVKSDPARFEKTQQNLKEALS